MSVKSKSSSIGSNNTSVNNDATKLKENETVTDRFDENAPRPRLCHLKKWPHFQGYGFNLHAERAKLGQHIGKVDAKSPAESAGLKEGDRIIEVNYVNISNENHQQVVKRIRNGLTADGIVYENEVVLLVVDNEADDYYKKLNVIVKHDFENVLKQVTQSKSDDDDDDDVDNNNNINESKIENKIEPADDDATTFNQNENKFNTSKSSTSSLASSAKSITNNTTSNNNNNNQDSLISNSSSNINEITSAEEQSNEQKLNKKTESTSSTSNLSVNSTSDNQTKSSKSNVATPVSQKKEAPLNGSHEIHQIKPVMTGITNTTTLTTKSHLINGDNEIIDPFQMSAAEFKNYLKSKSRNDPRIAPVDMKQKFQMFQDM